MLSGFGRDVFFAVRNLRRSPGFTAVAIAILAIGIGGSTALFSIVRGALLERWPYQGYERIVTFRRDSPRLARNNFPLFSESEYGELASRTDVFDFVIAGIGRGANLSLENSSERILVANMTANTFVMAGVSPLLGRVFTTEEDRPGGPNFAVLNYRFWQNHLAGRKDVVGTDIYIDRNRYTVIGVMPREFVWWNRDVWLPAQLNPQSTARADRRWYVQARLRKGVSVQQGEAALQTYTAQLQSQFGLPEYDHLRIRLIPLVTETLGDLRHVLWILLAAVSLVLIVASANVATLVLVRTTRRRGEIAVRLAVGASPSRILLQLLTENLVLALFAAAAGLILGSALLAPLISLIPGGIPAEAHIQTDWRVALFSVAAALMSAVIFGLLPALRSSHGNIADDMKLSSQRSTGGRPRAFDLFMITQFAIAVVVLASSLLVVRSVQRTLASSPGYDDRDVLTVNVALNATRNAADPSAAWMPIVAEASRLPGVTAAAASSGLPIGDGARYLFSTGVGTPTDASVEAVTPGYFETLRAPIRKGRDFAESDNASKAGVAIVNQSMAAQLWPNEDPLGKRLVMQDSGNRGREFTVIGVAGDIRRDALKASPAPAVFISALQAPRSTFVLFLRTSGSQESLYGSVRAALHRIAPGAAAFAPRSLAGLREDSLGSEPLAAIQLAAFAFIALMLSAIGIYGVTRYAVEQRTSEMGIRMALGATPRDLLLLVLGHSFKNLAIATIIGTVGGWMAVRMIAVSLEGMSGELSAMAFAIPPLVLAAVLAAYLPARKAATVQPLEALRSN